MEDYDFIAWEGTVKLVEQVWSCLAHQRMSKFQREGIERSEARTRSDMLGGFFQRTLALSEVVQELASSAQSFQSEEDVEWIKEQGEVISVFPTHKVDTHARDSSICP